MTEGILVKKSDDLLEITLDSPDRGNGMSDDQVIHLGDVLEAEHDKVRLIVLRANGPDFCTGRAQVGRRPIAGPEALYLRDAHDIVFRCYGAVRKSKAPVVSVVRGRAFGFGFALACVADVTLAAESAQFAITEFSHNIMPTMVMSALADRVDMKPLMHLVWTSKVIDARHAQMIGAVSDVFPDAQLDEGAQAFIDRLMKAPRPAALAVKDYGHGANPADMEKAVALGRNLHAVINTAAEMRKKG
ncbi:MAG TPA: enoyl-CoA hydratase/isomerase family protein [Beijerinckiaceae bacterium]